MTDDRRMTTDRFYGGISNRLQNLVDMLEYIDQETPSRDELTSWIISNTNAGSREAVNHHLPFLDSIELIHLDEKNCSLASYGKEYSETRDSEVLYEALSNSVKGFDILLQELSKESMTDEDIMNLLVSEFDEAEMTKPGPAIRHREWLQVLGFVERQDGLNHITEKGSEYLSQYDEDRDKDSVERRKSELHEFLGG